MTAIKEISEINEKMSKLANGELPVNRKDYDHRIWKAFELGQKYTMAHLELKREEKG
jgi:hypothetical protein